MGCINLAHPRVHLVLTKNVIQGEHALGVHHRREQRGRAKTHHLGGRIFTPKLREALF